MLDASVKEPSPEALRFIANIVDSQEYDLAVSWVAQNPVTILDPAQRFMNALGLSLKWQLRIHPYLYWFHPKKPAQYAEQDLEGKPDFELVLMAVNNGEELDLNSLSAQWRVLWNKALRLKLVRAYAWAKRPRHKRRMAEVLERLTAPI